MDQTICVNAWLFYGVCAMAALGFIQAIWTLIAAMRTPDSPFD